MFVNVKLLYGFFIGGYCYKVFSDMFFIVIFFYKLFFSG